MSIVDREKFVSEIVDFCLTTTGHAGAEIGPAIKVAILQNVLVDEGEWNKVLESEPDKLNAMRTRADLEHYIRTGLEFFPLGHVKEEDLEVIILALRVKFRPAVCGWPMNGVKRERRRERERQPYPYPVGPEPATS